VNNPAPHSTLPVNLANGPSAFHREPAPLLGEHTHKVLTALGLTDAEIAELIEDGSSARCSGSVGAERLCAEQTLGPANPPGLLEAAARVDRQGHTGDVARLVGGEEEHRVADVDGLDPGDGQGMEQVADRRHVVGARVLQIRPNILKVPSLCSMGVAT
jgi:hypothetical protein